MLTPSSTATTGNDMAREQDPIRENVLLIAKKIEEIVKKYISRPIKYIDVETEFERDEVTIEFEKPVRMKYLIQEILLWEDGTSTILAKILYDPVLYIKSCKLGFVHNKLFKVQFIPTSEEIFDLVDITYDQVDLNDMTTNAFIGLAHLTAPNMLKALKQARIYSENQAGEKWVKDYITAADLVLQSQEAIRMVKLWDILDREYRTKSIDFYIYQTLGNVVNKRISYTIKSVDKRDFILELTLKKPKLITAIKFGVELEKDRITGLNCSISLFDEGASRLHIPREHEVEKALKLISDETLRYIGDSIEEFIQSYMVMQLALKAMKI